MLLRYVVFVLFCFVESVLCVITQQNTTQGHKQPVQKLLEGECIPEVSGKRCGDSLSMITQWLYLGSYSDALDKSLLKRNNISYILNTAKECESADSSNSSDSDTDGEMWPTYLKLDLVDHADEAIASVFHKAYQFIDTARKENKRVLVHCRRGISRSATLVIAYLMQSQNLQLDEAFDFVRCCRSIINPNIGFVLSLETFAAQLGHKPKYVFYYYYFRLCLFTS